MILQRRFNVVYKIQKACFYLLLYTLISTCLSYGFRQTSMLLNCAWKYNSSPPEAFETNYALVSSNSFGISQANLPAELHR